MSHRLARDPPHSHPPPPLQNGSSHPQVISPVQGPAPANGAPAAPPSAIHKLTTANEQTWLLIGRVAEQMGDLEHALSAYENALRHNPMSLSGLTQVAGIARIKENYPKAIEFFQRVLGLQEENGEVWSALGHCYLMQDDLQKAYSAYQQALYLLPNPKEDPKLWYGIGILYDRYGSLDHAEEAFSSVLRMDKAVWIKCKDLDFDKANEILFRLGIIYKQQSKYDDSLNCFDRILRNPPSPLAHADIWFQIGHHVRAKDAYERVVADNPSHAKVLQQLGWLYHQDGFDLPEPGSCHPVPHKEFGSSWYLLGRAYMAGQKYNKAYEAYQQAVYRDGRNPTFWCSIGVLYFQINQYRDALDAYSRAIRINPYISEVWFDLGSLYESCNNQISDAIDAYARASELDPNNPVISQRLSLLKNAQATGVQVPAAPGPQDVHPTAYASAVVPPPGLTGPPLLLQSTSQRPPFRTDSRGPGEISLPPPSQVGAGRSSPGPFRGGPPPPVILDDSRHPPSHTPLAPMEVDRPPPLHSRDYPPSSSRDAPSGGRGPIGHQSLLLHHPVPQQQIPAEEIRNGGSHMHHQESYFTRRPQSASMSPPAHNSRIRSPPPPPLPSFPPYPSSSRGQPSGPGQPQRSPRTFPAHEQIRTGEPPEMGWDRRPPGETARDWPPREHEGRRPRHSGSGSDYPVTQPPPPQFYPPRSPGPHRGRSPPESSPRSAHPSHVAPSSRYWDPKPPSAVPAHARSSSADHASRRYDPRYDGRDHREAYENERSDSRGYPGSHAGSPEGLRNPARPPPPLHMSSTGAARSESPASNAPDGKRRRTTKDAEPPQAQVQEPARKERKKRSSKRKDDGVGTPQASTSYKVSPGYPKGPSSPGPVSSNGSGSSGRSVQPSPTSAAPRVPSRVVDDDYDEPGVADALMGLASYREMPAPSMEGNFSLAHGFFWKSPQRPGTTCSLPSGLGIRPLSPADEVTDNKRSRVEVLNRRDSSSVGRRTPVPSTRPSPIPFRTQPASHSPETREPYPASPPLPAVFPPHPRPVGAAGLSSSVHMIAPIALPPIATLSPTSTAASPAPSERDRERSRDRESRDDKMQVDSNHSASPPPTRSKPVEVVHLRTPPKHTPSPPSVEMKEATSAS
ncbi:TPR-like protein [Roridomyces roridus]|uniref:TPR-like protein n=1 Tax=Roridomyces roridus TaxID=1738132 RepID=A0AAD7BTC8_9AGAR|nr:TPR-like protein [Roridomyces roridus]